MKTRRFYFLISLITLLGMGQGHLKASNNEETINARVEARYSSNRILPPLNQCYFNFIIL